MIEFISKDTMSEQNKRMVRRFLTEVCNKGNIALIDELFAYDWIGHAPPKEFKGPAELKQFVAAQHRAFPDLELIVEDQIAEGDKVTTRWTARVTHLGEFQGIPPTGRKVTMTGISIYRIANNKFIEG
jgi:steroid delta-isomerase-like uncharacterized protein